MNGGRSVLVVVDVQNGFVTEHSDHVVSPIAQLAQQWQDAGQDVVLTRYLNYDDSPFERIMGWSKLKSPPETDLADAIQPLAERASACIDKKMYTMFTDEGEQLARARGWNEMYVCGIDTEVCVLKTAVDAFERGIRAWVLSDLSASHSGQAAHEAGLLVAGKMIGRKQVIDSSAIPARPSREVTAQ